MSTGRLSFTWWENFHKELTVSTWNGLDVTKRTYLLKWEGGFRNAEFQRKLVRKRIRENLESFQLRMPKETDKKE